MESLVTFLFLTAGVATAGKAADEAKDFKRIAVIGHSFTDGNTWPYLVRQALTDAGRPEPILINSAGGGDAAVDNVRRLDWGVLRYDPDLTIILATAHNVKHMTDDEYRAAMEEMITKLQAKGSKVLLLYGYMQCPAGMEPADMRNAEKVKEVVKNETDAMKAEAKKSDGEKAGEVGIQCQLAKRYDCLIGDMKPCVIKSFEQGNWLWEPDRLHPSFEGYRAIARAALDALGYRTIPVPTKMKIKVLPGLISPFRIRATAAGEAVLDEKTVLDERPDDHWTTYTLPEKDPQDSWWPDQVRQEGYAMGVEKNVGKSGRYIGYAVVHAEKPGTVYVNTSGGLQTVWFNGKRVFKAGEWNGFHIGAERIPVEAKAGENKLIFECGAQFAITVTPTALW